MDRERMVAVIMAGGGGTRFWPRSRKARPKQFLAPLGGDSFLKMTVDRVRDLIPPERILVITGEEHVDLVVEHTGLPRSSVVAEPEGRDTAACIGFGALRARAIREDAVMVVLPADHMIEPVEGFHESLIRAVELAASSPKLVTIGLRPHRPSTGYGYIEVGARVDDGIPIAHRVHQFAEKPDLETARRFVLAGKFLWNSGIFAFSTGTVLKAIREHLPELHARLMDMRDPTDDAEIRRVYPTLPKISIDYGVLEKAEERVVVEASFKWDDVGTFDAVGRRATKHEAGNVSRGEAYFHGSERSQVDNDLPGLVVISGLDDILVVRTKDAVLVMPRGKSEHVKSIVADIEKAGHGKYL